MRRALYVFTAEWVVLILLKPVVVNRILSMGGVDSYLQTASYLLPSYCRQ